VPPRVRDLPAIYAPVQGDLDALDGLLRAELASGDAFLGELVNYVLGTRGKLIRPALACLSAEAIGGGKTERLYVAATVELIHIASLIHDDIIDAADVRRGAATVNVQWGNQLAVLLGDLLFARAFDLISRVRHPEVAPALAHAAVRMSQAEIKQVQYSAEPHSEEAVYLDIIAGKTAHLCSAACRAGGLVAGATAEQAQALAAFGLAWGMSFQITDDALDLTSRREDLGKPIGSDIHGGRVTLPVIHALRTADAADGAALRRLQQAPATDGAMAEVRRILDRYGAIPYAQEVARTYSDQAAAALAALPPSAARESLQELSEFVLVRLR